MSVVVRSWAGRRPPALRPAVGGQGWWKAIEPVGARLLVALAVLNVNNIIFMMTGERQVVSLLMLLVSGVLLLLLWGRTPKRRGLVLFLGAVGVYLAMGTLSSWANGASITAAPWLRYGATAVIVAALSLHTQAASAEERVSFLRFVHLALIAAAASVWLTPVLMPLWKHVPLAFEDRLSGVFANPNEAGFVAALAFAFTLFLPSRRGWERPLFLIISIGAVVLSFSKSAAFAAMLILALFVLKSSRRAIGLALAGAAIAGALLVVNLPSALEWVARQDSIPMNREQRDRVDEFADVLSGRFNEQTTTGRIKLWQVGSQRIAEHPISGSGLDSFLFLEGGHINPVTGQWQGIHNVFLMILGEGGVISFAVFLAFFAWIALRVPTSALPYLSAAILVVVLIDMNSNHSALALRYSNVVLGILIALTSWKPARPSAR